MKRGVVEHRNDAGDAPGATLILTVRRDASNAFNHMSEAERLFAHAGIALSWADTPLRRALAEFDEAEQWFKSMADADSCGIPY